MQPRTSWLPLFSISWRWNSWRGRHASAHWLQLKMLGRWYVSTLIIYQNWLNRLRFPFRWVLPTRCIVFRQWRPHSPGNCYQLLDLQDHQIGFGCQFWWYTRFLLHSLCKTDTPNPSAGRRWHCSGRRIYDRLFKIEVFVVQRFGRRCPCCSRWGLLLLSSFQMFLKLNQYCSFFYIWF